MGYELVSLFQAFSYLLRSAKNGERKNMGEVLAVFRARAPTITERLKEAKGLIIWREDAPARRVDT